MLVSVLLNRRCHVHHDHADGVHIHLILVVGGGLGLELWREELNIFTCSCRPCHRVGELLILPEGITVGQLHSLVAIFAENQSLWVDSSMHRFLCKEGLKHLD